METDAIENRTKSGESEQPRSVVVITGASGFIGRALATELAGQYDVIGLDFALPDAPLIHV